MPTVAVIGAASRVAQAMLPRLDAGIRLVGIDRRDPPRWRHRDEVHCVDLAHTDWSARLRGVDVIAHVGGMFDPVPDAARSRRVNVEATRRMLEAASTAGVRRVIHVSSAIVYGAWESNPASISETHPLRPNAGFETAVELAEVERLLDAWRAADSTRRVCRLRTAIAGGSNVDHVAARVLAGLPPLNVRGARPRVQLVHIDDLAAAVVHALDAALDGVFNVACDGALDIETVRTMVGPPAWPPLPLELVQRIVAMGWATGTMDVPPEAVPLLVHPPVLDNAALRATGWEPAHDNADVLRAIVETHASAVRRLRWAVRALAVGSVAGVVTALGAATLMLRWWRGGRPATRPSRA